MAEIGETSKTNETGLSIDEQQASDLDDAKNQTLESQQDSDDSTKKLAEQEQNRPTKHENGQLAPKAIHANKPAEINGLSVGAKNDQLKLRPASSSRKSSTVSFKDVCELFEIDIEASKRPQKPPAVFSLRYYVMILALFSPFIVTYSRTIINFAIIDMIEPDFLNQRHNEQQTTSTTPSTTISAMTTDFYAYQISTLDSANYTDTVTVSTLEAYFDTDNSCPVDDETRRRLESDLEIDKIRAHERPGEKFEWDTVKQGLLKAAYSIGHALLQVVGGRLSEIHGSHLIMGLSSALIGVCCLVAPFLASAHFYLLFFDLFLLGILGSFMTPALITLFSNWLTPSEKSIMLSFYMVSSRLGFAFSSLLCGFLIQAQLSWRYLFYSAGWIALLFSIIFFACSRSRPQEHPLIGQLELDYLASKNRLVREALNKATERQIKSKTYKMDNMTQNGKSTSNTTNGSSSLEHSPDKQQAASCKPTTGAPWLAILTNAPVWAFIVTKFCVKLAGDTVQIELPTYLKRVMHLTPRHNGIVNASNYVIFCASCIMVGALAKTANKRHPFGWTKTTVRKVFQTTASFGSGLSLLGISFCVCKETSTLVLLMLMFFFTTFGTGGEAQIPLDISERYSGTIHALGSSLAISGAIEPILVGFLLKEYPADRDRWAAVWMGASSIAFAGGLIFMFFGDATIQAFDSIGLDDQAERLEKQDKPAANVSSNKSKLGDAINGNATNCGELKSQSTVRTKGYVNESFEKEEDDDCKVDAAGKEVRPHRESVQI